MVISFGQILANWEAMGIFDYGLPFIFIFAVVFGVLSSTNILGKNKGVQVIISLVIGAMAIRTGAVQQFFMETIPSVGVALVAIVALVVMVGLFIHDEESRYWAWGISGLAVIIWIFIVLGSSERMGGYFSRFAASDIASFILLALVGVGIIIAIASSGKERTNLGGTISKIFKRMNLAN